MKKIALYASALLCLSSCATILNKNYVTFRINVDRRADVRYTKEWSDAEYNVHSPADTASSGDRKEVYITAKRSKKESVTLVIKKDGVERSINVKPIHSSMFYCNVCSLYWLGFLVDLNSERRFTYPREVFVIDSLPRGYSTHLPFDNLRQFEKHKWELSLNPPLTNIYTTKYNYAGPSVNPWGVVGAINYHFSPKRYLSVEAGGCIAQTIRYRDRSRINDSLGNVPHLPGESKTDAYLNIAHNHILQRFDIGYGLNIGIHNACRYYTRENMGDTVIYREGYTSLGFVASAHYRLNKDIYVGVNYMPQLLAIGTDTKMIYEHALNCGFSFRVGAGKKKE